MRIIGLTAAALVLAACSGGSPQAVVTVTAPAAETTPAATPTPSATPVDDEPDISCKQASKERHPFG